MMKSTAVYIPYVDNDINGHAMVTHRPYKFMPVGKFENGLFCSQSISFLTK